jgi:hypothetical protein
MKNILILLLTILATAGFAQIITVNLTVTNGTTNGMSLTLNGDTRTFTNSVSSPGSQQLTNITAQGSANNLYTNILNNPFAGPALLSWSASTNLTITGANSEAMAVTISGNWVSYSTVTQAVVSMAAVRVPLSGETATAQTNIATQLETGLNAFSQAQISGGRAALLVKTNFPGSNNWTGDLAFTGNALTLANGNNVDLSTGNVFYRITGPTGAFYISGLIGGRDGQQIILENATGYSLTVSNNVTSETVSTNRVLTGVGGPVTMTNVPSFVHLIYDGNASLWDVEYHSN